MNDEKKELQVTPKMLEFFMDASKEYAKNLKGIPDQEEHFKFVCDKMLNHEDKDIRIQFSKVLMFLGFSSLMKSMTEALMSSLKKGLFGEG